MARHDNLRVQDLSVSVGVIYDNLFFDIAGTCVIRLRCCLCDCDAVPSRYEILTRFFLVRVARILSVTCGVVKNWVPVEMTSRKVSVLSAMFCPTVVQGNLRFPTAGQSLFRCPFTEFPSPSHGFAVVNFLLSLGNIELKVHA